jgi:uncharacterized protein YdiU (UPF0061 family)
MGRYAYANQPRIALWNLTRLAECLLPLFSDDKTSCDRQVANASRRIRTAQFMTALIRPALLRQARLSSERDGDEAAGRQFLKAPWRTARRTSPSPSATCATHARQAVRDWQRASSRSLKRFDRMGGAAGGTSR